MERQIEFVKHLATALAVGSAVCYAFGYLALRARANALGTDPAFRLLDQVYVFAGLRFFIVTLVLGLFAAPLILVAARLFAAANARLPTGAKRYVERLALMVLLVLTILALCIVMQSGVLLTEGSLPREGIAAALIGADARLRVLLSVAPVVLAGLSFLWLWKELRDGGRPLAGLLAAIVSLQLFVLPIFHGALFADRRVRVLVEVPFEVHGLLPPVAIVDRTSDQVVLLGLNQEARRGLANVAAERLDGIVVHEVLPLWTFLKRLEGEGAPEGEEAALSTWSSSALYAQAASSATDGSDFATRFYGIASNFLDVLFEAIGSLSGGPARPGSLWAVDLDASGRPLAVGRLGDADDLLWPVPGANADSVLALRKGRVVRIGVSGDETETLTDGAQWEKLIGEGPDGAVLGLVRTEEGLRPAVRTSEGKIEIGPAPSSPEQRLKFALLVEHARAYRSGHALFVRRSARGGRGTDVYLQFGEAMTNLSDCGNDFCSQPTLTPDHRRVFFIKANRY